MGCTIMPVKLNHQEKKYEYLLVIPLYEDLLTYIMIIVTCAIIRNEENEILVVQRGEATDHPFKWEFPGGKLAPEETEEECIIREVNEELSMEIVICGKLQEVDHDYGHKQIDLFLLYAIHSMKYLFSLNTVLTNGLRK